MKKKFDTKLIKEIIIATVIFVILLSVNGNFSKTQEVVQEGDYSYNEETGENEVYYEGRWINETIYQQIIDEKLQEEENAWQYEPIYFLPNGYYYHSTKECKGLKDCYNIKEDIFGNISEYKHLDACNWCN